MKTSVPQYRLFSVADSENRPGYWRFRFCVEDGRVILDTEDLEPRIRGARLELLTLVRALESLDHPANITLATGSRYIREGLRFGIPEWRKNGWRWECFGRMIPVRNGDLWQRVDRALAIHRVSCEPRTERNGFSLERFADRQFSASRLPRPMVQDRSRKRGKFGRRTAGLADWFISMLRTRITGQHGFLNRSATWFGWSASRMPSGAMRLHWRQACQE